MTYVDQQGAALERCERVGGFIPGDACTRGVAQLVERLSFRGDGHERIILRALALVQVSAPGVVAVGSALARRMVA